MNENNTLNSLQNAIFNINQEINIPAGYLAVELSTKGKLGAPALFHIRNFKVSDIITLSLTADTDIPHRLIQILNDAIYEDVDVGEWHEKEVEELMFNVFSTFYKSVLTEIEFPIEEEDLEYIRDVDEDLYKSILNKEWTPRTNINLFSDVVTYELPEDFTPQIKISNKKTGFFVVFDYIKYKDQVTIKRWLEDFYKKETIKFKIVEDQIAYNEGIYEKAALDSSVLSKLIFIDPELEREYKEFTAKKLQTALEIVRVASIINYNGEDVSNLSIDEKYKRFANDAQIDYGLIVKLEKRQKKQLIGINPDVYMWNPIKNERCQRRFSFRIPSMLQAMQLLGDSEYDDGYDDEYEY